ncbi:hypothetical protein EVG20_g1461 [Dentipellis fragilis]|uniref:Uncharacterized protein n=1 Tax=Dentipellis fragilis TaxID=205917 RepID=A0A4Y9ZC45_9AGAM|nr:hypothetical protein EVG20_g1461 [Dentipellis fragilis]
MHDASRDLKSAAGDQRMHTYMHEEDSDGDSGCEVVIYCLMDKMADTDSPGRALTLASSGQSAGSEEEE